MANLGTLFPSTGLYDARLVQDQIVDKWTPRTAQGLMASNIVLRPSVASVAAKFVAAINNTRRYVEPQPVTAPADLSPVASK